MKSSSCIEIHDLVNQRNWFKEINREMTVVALQIAVEQKQLKTKRNLTFRLNANA